MPAEDGCVRYDAGGREVLQNKKSCNKKGLSCIYSVSNKLLDIL